MGQSAGLKIEKCGIHESGVSRAALMMTRLATGPVWLLQVGCSQAGASEHAEHAQ